jgi:hypothetical protein
MEFARIAEDFQASAGRKWARDGPAAVSRSCACIGSPCLRRCGHGATIGGHGVSPTQQPRQNCPGRLEGGGRCGGRCVLAGGGFDWDLPVRRLFLSRNIVTQRPRPGLMASPGAAVGAVGGKVRRPLRPCWRPFWLGFTYAASVLTKNY